MLIVSAGNWQEIDGNSTNLRRVGARRLTWVVQGANCLLCGVCVGLWVVSWVVIFLLFNRERHIIDIYICIYIYSGPAWICALGLLWAVVGGWLLVVVVLVEWWWCCSYVGWGRRSQSTESCVRNKWQASYRTKKIEAICLHILVLRHAALTAPRAVNVAWRSSLYINNRCWNKRNGNHRHSFNNQSQINQASINNQSIYIIYI